MMSRQDVADAAIETFDRAVNRTPKVQRSAKAENWKV